jgi:O-antigen/teichoic acid export membrane protein
MQVISVPLTLHYLGQERFGMWMTMSSFVLILNFADLGIGNGLINAVAQSDGENDQIAMQRWISSATALLLLPCIAVIALALGSLTLLRWPDIYNVVTPQAIADAGPASVALITCVALSIPLSVVERVQTGLQMGYVAQLWQAGGSVLGLVALLAGVKLGGSLWVLALAMFGGSVVASVINWIIFFYQSRPDLRPRIRLASSSQARVIFTRGVWFLILQLVVAIMYSSDNLIVAHVFGADAVAAFALPDKLFSVVPMIIMLMLMPLWPAYGEASARSDGRWMRSTLFRTLVLACCIGAALSVALLIFANWILSVWTDTNVQVPVLLLAALAVWRTIDSAGNAMSIYLNATNVLGPQALIAIALVAFGLPLKFYLTTNFGISGPVWATAICYSVIALPALALLVRHSFARFRSGS